MKAVFGGSSISKNVHLQSSFSQILYLRPSAQPDSGEQFCGVASSVEPLHCCFIFLSHRMHILVLLVDVLHFLPPACRGLWK